MTRLFSARELYNVRNDIPVSALIETVLNMPTRTTEGVFRFLCPVCGEFNTAVNFKTNLARCFSCEKNFNTIDLVMIAEKMNFVKAVRFLKAREKNSQSRSGSKKTVDRSRSPQHMADIIQSIMPKKPVSGHQESIESISKRVLCIEKKLEQMIHHVEIITKAIT
jgi:DNA primase